ncbi:common pilus major fimbrillin subunit EcpA [Yersinia mollaretii]|uniref:common pilus major fimbrillin subunit EcpA n=1 Tax=Yersinia mollaretii TaxID=33060 RepID=UPI0005E049DE|nr:common pilus major fimbrillin subunit EcpA [Yersinia mollaretii]PJE88300.1 hypothetical protein CU280_09165 [Yersinia mollaretii]CQD41547.1 Meningitis associated and temperature regulated protein B [Yersinia mollaretii]CQH06634.1 Meningitis associated and temperature regulated protein B [Yersinia mollaretii]
MKKLSMKKNAVAAMVVMSIFAATNVAHAVSVVKTNTATWTVTANKLSSASLAVNATGTLPVIAFSTSNVSGATVSSFSAADAPFEVVLGGDASATAFTLTAMPATGNRLTSTADSSYLDIGVSYNNAIMSSTAQTNLYTNTTTTGSLSNLGNIAVNNGVGVAGDKFTFQVIGASADGTSTTTNYGSLPNTSWSGNVGVNFTATWTEPA